MAERDEQFKTTWKGGYDKDDVHQGFQSLKDDIYEEQHRLQRDIADMDRDIAEKTAKIADMERRMAKCEEELLELRVNVRDNFQPYIDSYDAIGSQIYEARVYADTMQREIREERASLMEAARDDAKQMRDSALEDADRMREEAKNEAAQMIAEARKQNEIQEEIGRRKYEAVQQELHMVLGDFNQVQRKFMYAFKSINDVLDDETGELARMRLEVLRAESPTTRIPELPSHLRGEEIDVMERDIAVEDPVEAEPTKILRDLREEITDAGL